MSLIEPQSTAATFPLLPMSNEARAAKSLRPSKIGLSWARDSVQVDDFVACPLPTAPICARRSSGLYILKRSLSMTEALITPLCQLGVVLFYGRLPEWVDKAGGLGTAFSSRLGRVDFGGYVGSLTSQGKRRGVLVRVERFWRDREQKCSQEKRWLFFTRLISEEKKAGGISMEEVGIPSCWAAAVGYSGGY